MRQSLFMVLLGSLLSAGLAAAGEMRQIELADGSVLTGEIVSLTNGVYTIRTDSLGTVRIEDKRIRSIRNQSAASSTAPAASSRALQERMEGDPEVMSMIRALKDDPDFRSVLDDPALLKAVEAGDIAALMANPRFQQLLNNSKVREIQNKVTN